MNINISGLIFDLDGHVRIKALAGSSLGDNVRRVTKSKTLDGGVVVNDGGFSWGDKDYSIIWRTRDRVFEDQVKNIVANQPEVRVGSIEGIFLAVPESYSESGGESTLNLMIKQRYE